MLVLLLAEAGSTNALGPGVGDRRRRVLLAGLTLLPALLTIVRARGFWPRRRTVAYDPSDALVERAGSGGASATACCSAPGSRSASTVALFGFLALGLLAYKEDYSITGFFKEPTESVEGFEVARARRSRPARSRPTTVLVDAPSGRSDARRHRARARARAGRRPASPTAVPSGSSRGRRMPRSSTSSFDDDPLAEAALARVAPMRDRLEDVAPGVTALSARAARSSRTSTRRPTRDLKRDRAASRCW